MALIGKHLDRLAASPDAEARLRDLFRQGLFLAILLAVWISTKPFQVMPTDGVPIAGDLANQLTFSGLAVCAALALLFADRRALSPVLQPSYLLIVVWMLVTTVMSTQPQVSERAFAFTVIVMFLAAALFALPQRLSDFQRLLFAAAAMVLGLSYLGVIAVPDLAKHTDFDPFEPEHAGSWKGHFDHKNIAGAMMAVIAAIGIYALRLKRWVLGGLLLAGGIAFLYFTKSKTSFALFPLVVICCLMAERSRGLTAKVLLCLGPVFALLLITLGSAFFPYVASSMGPSVTGDVASGITAMNQALAPDPTFTGRFDIWRYGIEMVSNRPLAGYGFEGFWQTSTTLQGESRQELSWAVEKIIHGHNGYLDVALTQGLVGLSLVVFVFLIKPVVDYHRAAKAAENRALASMFLMIWLFISLGQCLEVYYFRRADPVWFALLFASLGLRFTAAFRIDQSPSRAGPSS
jgi:O-antigen ligase